MRAPISRSTHSGDTERRPSRRRGVLAGSLITLAAWGCGGSLEGPETVRHPNRAFAEVPYPPPAALVETVPAQPPGDPVWVDGYWTWRGNYYVWIRGGWVQPPEAALYATWQVVLVDDGRLLFAPGAWYDSSHREIEPPKMLAVASTPPNQVTTEAEAAR